MTLRRMLIGLSLAMVATGCGDSAPIVGPADGDSTHPQSKVSPGQAVMRGGNIQSVLGLYTVTVDGGSASVTPSALRNGMANDDLYLLPVDTFLKPDSLQVRSVAWTPTTVDLTWEFKHPFPAPSNPTGLPNGSTNRADLGIAGALVILQDVDTLTGNTFFTDRVANTSLVVNAEAYLSPETMVSTTAIANTFPYQTLVDERGFGSRLGLNNGGDPTGNFGTDGWTQSEFGPLNDGWTGYGVLHQGQTSQRVLSLSRSALAAGEVLTFDVAVLAKYNDPRGGSTGLQRRGNRLPPASPDPTRFAYRMPHGALDVERLAFLGESGGYVANQATVSTLAFRLDDWDTRATETTTGDLSTDLDVTAVAVGEAGIPELAICIPGILGDHTTSVDLSTGLADDDTAYGGDASPDSGRPGDGLVYVSAVPKPAGTGQSGGDYVGLARAIDPEVANISDPAFILELDGTLAPLSGLVPQPITFQHFRVTLGDPNQPPSGIATVTTPVITTGSGVGISVSNLIDPDSPNVYVSIDWNADSTIDFTSGPIAVPGGPVAYASQTDGAMTFTFNPPGPDYRTLAIFVSDGSLMVEITPALGVNNEHFQVIPNQPGWVKTWGSASGDTHPWGVAVDSAGNAYTAGEYSTGANMGGGARSAVGGQDIYISKHDPAGNWIWDRTFGSAGGDGARAITCDAAGNVYVTGYYGGSVNFGGGARTMAGNVDCFTAKFDATGTWQWDRTWGSFSDDRGWGIGVNSTNTEVAVTGLHSGAWDYGGGLRPGTGRFLVRLNATTGLYIWDAPWTVSQGTNIYGDCEYDPSGNLYAVGHYINNNNFGDGPRPTVGGIVDDAFLCKFNGSGVFQWAKTLGGPDTEVGQSLTIDSAGNAFLGIKSFGSNTYLSGSPSDDHLAVVKYDPSGNVVWDYFVFGGQSTWGLVCDPSDNLYFTGGFIGTVNFGGGPRGPAGGFAPMLVKLNSSGTWQWDAVFAFGSGVNYAFGLDLASDGSARLAGVFNGTKDFDPGPAVFNQTAFGGGWSGYLCRINPGGTW